MSVRRHNKESGFTLIETAISIAVVGAGLAGVLMAFSSVVGASGDPLVNRQMSALAEGMMEEVSLRAYSGAGTITGCDRTAAAGVSDYNGYDQVPCTPTGTPLAGLSDYRVAVAVAPEALWQGIAADSARITVTASHPRTGSSFRLVGWRTNYAGP